MTKKYTTIQGAKKVLREHAERQDLRKRTKAFAVAAVRLCRDLPVRRMEVSSIARQLIRSAPSVAANFREASRGRSTAEFVSKVEICVQEADESLLWVELLQEACDIENEKTRALWDEADQLVAILTTVAKNAKRHRD